MIDTVGYPENVNASRFGSVWDLLRKTRCSKCSTDWMKLYNETYDWSKYIK